MRRDPLRYFGASVLGKGLREYPRLTVPEQNQNWVPIMSKTELSGRIGGRVVGGLLSANTAKRDGRSLGDGFVVRDHFDRVPRAVLGTERAADAPVEVHFHHLLHLGLFRPGDDLDAIHRTKHDADLTARAAVLIDDGKFWRGFFTCGFLSRVGRHFGSFASGFLAHKLR